MELKFLRARDRGIVLLALVITAAIGIAANSSPVSADPCTAQLSSYAVMKAYYYNSNMQLILPVSASCSLINSRLYAVGYAYDSSTNGDLGSANTALTYLYGGNTYTGQLVFSLPPAIMGHTLQISVSIYGGRYYRWLLTRTTGTVQVGPGGYQNCGYYGCYYPGPGYNYNYNVCQSSSGNTVQCSGYLYQDSSGCTELAIPMDNAYWAESRIYQYYTLQNLPSSFNPNQSWVTVTGQIYQGYNTAPSGAACPGNYIAVTSISP